MVPYAPTRRLLPQLVAVDTSLLRREVIETVFCSSLLLPARPPDSSGGPGANVKFSL